MQRRIQGPRERGCFVIVVLLLVVGRVAFQKHFADAEIFVEENEFVGGVAGNVFQDAVNVVDFFDFQHRDGNVFLDLLLDVGGGASVFFGDGKMKQIIITIAIVVNIVTKIVVVVNIVTKLEVHGSKKCVVS